MLQQEVKRLRKQQAAKPVTIKGLNGKIGALKRKVKEGEEQLAVERARLKSLCDERGISVEEVGPLKDKLAKERREKEEQAANAEHQRIAAARQEIARLRKEDETSRGFFESLFGNKALKPETQRLVAVQEQKIEAARAVLAVGFRTNEKQAEVFTAHAIVNNLYYAVLTWKTQLRDLESKKRILLAEEEARSGKDKAIVAAYMDRTRERADSIKDSIYTEQIRSCPHCPYCGGEYGLDPQADHIYAVSRGGLSTPENMVYVCLLCNRRKGDMTLREFVAKHNLDRDRIEKTLELLKKRF